MRDQHPLSRVCAKRPRGANRKALRWSRIQLSNIWPDSFWLASSMTPKERRSLPPRRQALVGIARVARVPRRARAQLDWSEIPAPAVFTDFVSEGETNGVRCRLAAAGHEDLTATIHVTPIPPDFRIPVTFAGKNGLVLLDEMRTLDKQRLVRRLGAVERRTLRAALMRLRDIFAD